MDLFGPGVDVVSAVHTSTTAVATMSGTSTAGTTDRLLHLAPAPAAEPVTTEPATVPSAPTGVTATAGSRSATVTWTPVADGESPVTGQTVHVHSGTQRMFSGSVAAEATSARVTGLKAGAACSFTVTPTTAIGTSPGSARSNTVVVRR